MFSIERLICLLPCACSWTECLTCCREQLHVLGALHDLLRAARLLVGGLVDLLDRLANALDGER
jgi:hypothetical protein